MKKPACLAHIQKKEEFWLFVIIVVYFIAYSTLSLLRHYTYHSFILDLGNFEQILWNTSQGRWFALSTRPWTNSYLGDHFSPILIIPSLIYKFLPYTATILIFQTALIAVSAYLVFLLAKAWGFTKKHGLYFALIFLTFPALGFVNMFDAHANVFAIPIGLLFLLAFKRQKYNQLIIFFLLLLFIKEDLSLILAAFGFSIAIEKRDRYLGLFIFFLSIAWFYLVMTVLIPSFSINGGYHYVEQLVGNQNNGTTFSILNQPILIIKTIFSQGKIEYVLALFSSMLFIPIFAGRYALPVIIGLMPILLNRWTSFMTIFYHYPASFIAFIIFALMAGLYAIKKNGKINPNLILRLIMFIQIAIISLAIFSNFLGEKYCKTYFCLSKYSQTRSHEITTAINLIPQTASVSASNNLGSHLAKRKELYILPRLDNAKYILIDKQAIGRWNPYNIENEVFLSIDSSEKYKMVFSEKDIYLFERNK